MFKFKKSCQPQNDLDCYYNSRWEHEKQSCLQYKSSIDNFMLHQEKIDNFLKNYIMNLTFGNDEIKNNLLKFNKSYINRFKFSQIVSNLIKNISECQNINDIAEYVKILMEYNIGSLFNFNIVSNFQDPSVYVLEIDELSLTLLDKDSYSENKNLLSFAKTLGHIYDYVHEFWDYNLSDKKTFSDNIVIFETLFSNTILNLKDRNNPDIISNSLTFIEFKKEFDVNGFWDLILHNYCQDNSIIAFPNKKFLYLLQKYLNNLTTKDFIMLKDYIIFSVVNELASYTDMYIYFTDLLNNDNNVDKIYKTLMFNAFGFHLQDIYNFNFENIDKNKKIQSLFDSLKNQCKYYFLHSDMFDEETKKTAIKKIELMDIIIGKSDYTIDLKELPQLNFDFYTNYLLLGKFYFKKIIAMYNKPVNRHYLSINNNTFSFNLNAYYDPNSNIIYVPTSITDNFYFDNTQDDIYNYGGMGSIIGHEIVHSFDIFGSKYDEYGHLKNWWTKKSFDSFNIQVEKIVKDYSNLKIDGLSVNGVTTVGENMADIGGLKLSLHTYLKKHFNNINLYNLSCSQKEHIKIFFKRWAMVFRSIAQKYIVKILIQIDVHAPLKIRINAPFRHINEYYIVYDVKESDKNYLKPELRTSFLDF